MKSVNRLLLGMTLIVFTITASKAKRWKYYEICYDCPPLQVEIFHPQGLKIWYPKLPDMVKFVVHVNVNREYPSEGVPCDIDFNTTAISYGKFIVQDDNAVIRVGDNLKFVAFLHKKNGRELQIMSEFIVYEHFINQLKDNQCPSSNVNEQSNVTRLQEEVDLLKSVIYDMIQPSNNGSEISNNLFLNGRPEAVELKPPQLYNHTLELLQENLPKINWKTVLTNAFYYNDGVGFEVKTLLDKLKILQMAKGLTKFTVTDLDGLGAIGEGDDDYTTDGSPVIFHVAKSAE